MFHRHWHAAFCTYSLIARFKCCCPSSTSHVITVLAFLLLFGWFLYMTLWEWMMHLYSCTRWDFLCKNPSLIHQKSHNWGCNKKGTLSLTMKCCWFNPSVLWICYYCWLWSLLCWLKLTNQDIIMKRDRRLLKSQKMLCWLLKVGANHNFYHDTILY